MTGTSPPGPFRCGSTTWRTSPAATAASNALPPRSSTAIPAAEASQWVEATMPNVPASSGRVVNSGISAMTRSSHPSSAGGALGDRAVDGRAERSTPLLTVTPIRSGAGVQGHADPVASVGMDLSPRVRAVCDLDVSEVREYAGRHEYDGKPQDLSPAGVRAGLARLAAARAGGEAAAGPARRGSPDRGRGAEAGHLRRARAAPPEPDLHLGELDLACYDRDYAPQAERDAARAEHLAAWPRVADAAVESLDQVSAPVAEALLGGIRGLAAGLERGADGRARARDRGRRAGRARPPGRARRARGGETAIPTRRSAPPGSPP